MNGELAQMIVLATHGSVWLADPSVAPPQLDRDNGTFRYVDSVAFDLVEPAPARASDVASWLTQRVEVGIERLWLVIPERRRDQVVATTSGKRTLSEDFLAGLAGAGSWSLRATGEDRIESWRASWKTWTLPDGSRPPRVWRVQYVGRTIDSTLPPNERIPATPSVAAARASLLAALHEIREFARSIDYEPWPQWFDDAVALADPIVTPVPTTWFGGLPDRGFSDESKRLLAVATKSWVFGGMGWWGDALFADEKVNAERDRLGTVLYAALLRACAAAVNAPLAAA